MDTPESIRQQYAAPADESPEARRRRLANRRAAKYRYLRGLSEERSVAQREKSSVRQRNRRARLDDAARAVAREQNRQRQALRRERLSEGARQDIRDAQRERQQRRRQALNEPEREELRARERLRLRKRRQRERDAHCLRSAPLRKEGTSDGEEAKDEAPSRLPQLLVNPGGSDRRPILGHDDGVPNLLATEPRHDKELPAFRPPPRQHAHAPFSSIQFPLPPPPPPAQSPTQGLQPLHASSTSMRLLPDRGRPLPHLQVTLPQTSSLLHGPPPPLLLMPAPPSASLPIPVSSKSIGGPVPPPSKTSVATGGLGTASSLGLPIPQPPLAPIVLPPAHRSLPPLPDFLNSREAFDPSIAASSTFFPPRSDSLGDYHDV